MTNTFVKKSAGGNRKFDRNRFDRGPRRNERIRVPEVRVIGPDGEQFGVMATRDALLRAKGFGLDLVEVSANSMPPVCRILNYGKYKYDEDKKSKGQQKSNASKFKEVKFRPAVDVGDYNTKVRHAQEFLSMGFKVKLTLMFRGREMAHQELGFDVVRRAIADLQDVSSVDAQPRLAGRSINAMLSPRSRGRKKEETTTDNDDRPFREEAE
ncbi:MAG: translation initiation factor IF-3 [Puniceicoccales bacterium]|jgi:translation initiation factor IF-3|nr:translation initiation factor IF-3 [Puniceicoccales bacterium]